MEFILFVLIVWGAIALIRAAIRSHQAEQEKAHARAAEKARAEATQRWLASLKGIADDGRSRFAVALDECLSSGDWGAVHDMVGTLPDWPIRALLDHALNEAQRVRESIRLAYAAGVAPPTCERYYQAQLELESALWTILVQTAIVGQSPGVGAGWRRVSKHIRRGVDEDRREVERITRLMDGAVSGLQDAMASRDRSPERRAGRALDDAARAAGYLAHDRRRTGRQA